MTNNYHRRDSTHKEIVETLKQLGCSVRDTSQLGDKGSDLIVGLIGKDFQVECKTGQETISAEQAEYYSGWRGASLVVLRDRDEATAWVNQVRSQR